MEPQRTTTRSQQQSATRNYTHNTQQRPCMQDCRRCRYCPGRGTNSKKTFCQLISQILYHVVVSSLPNLRIPSQGRRHEYEPRQTDFYRPAFLCYTTHTMIARTAVVFSSRRHCFLFALCAAGPLLIQSQSAATIPTAQTCDSVCVCVRSRQTTQQHSVFLSPFLPTKGVSEKGSGHHNFWHTRPPNA